MIIILILEILQRAALITGILYALDIAHDGEIDLHLPKVKHLRKSGFIYRFMMKLADKLESALAQRRRAWSFRARKEVKRNGN